MLTRHRTLLANEQTIETCSSPDLESESLLLSADAGVILSVLTLKNTITDSDLEIQVPSDLF